MRYLASLAACACMIVGCSGGAPSDSDQQKLANDWSPEKVAEAYEKQGKHAEAEEVRRGAHQSQQ